MGISVVFSGQVRDRSRFEHGIRSVANLKTLGLITQIIYSTWHHEIETFDGLEAFLDSNGVDIIRSRPPELLLDYEVNPPPPKSVTILQQIKALRLAIDLCPSDNWVVRLRPDVFPAQETLSATLQNLAALACKPINGWPQIFESKIVTLGGLCFHPLFLNDTCYIGRRNDLRALAQPEIYAQIFGLRMNTEQHLFAPRFLNSFPILGQFFQVNAGLQHGNSEIAERLLEVSLEDSFFIDVLAVSYLIMNQYFCVGFHERSEERTEKLRNLLRENKLTVEDFFIGAKDNKYPGVTYFEPASTLTYSEDYWITHLIDGSFLPSRLGDRMADAIGRMRDMKSQEQYDTYLVKTAQAALDYRSKLFELSNQLPIYFCDFPLWDGNRVTIEGRLMQASIIKSP